MIIVGVLLACLSVASFGFAVWISVDTEGGAVGQVPVMAHAIGVPVLALVSALTFARAWPAWSLPASADVAAFMLAVVAVGGLLHMAGRLGRRMHQRRGMGPGNLRRTSGG